MSTTFDEQVMADLERAEALADFERAEEPERHRSTAVLRRVEETAPALVMSARLEVLEAWEFQG